LLASRLTASKWRIRLLHPGIKPRRVGGNEMMIVGTVVMAGTMTGEEMKSGEVETMTDAETSPEEGLEMRGIHLVAVAAEADVTKEADETIEADEKKKVHEKKEVHETIEADEKKEVHETIEADETTEAHETIEADEKIEAD